MYGLIFAHISHLVLNWGYDSFVLVQRPNCSKIDARDQKSTPFALPPKFPVKWFRLLMAVVFLVVLSYQSRESEYEPNSVSVLAHVCGALGGLLTGCIFLQAKNKNTWIQFGKILLLALVYGFCIVVIGYKLSVELEDNNEICPWNQYMKLCQEKCYKRQNVVSENCTSMSLC